MDTPEGHSRRFIKNSVKTKIRYKNDGRKSREHHRRLYAGDVNITAVSACAAYNC